ncbi:hypothetical protein ACFQ5D_03075 [Paenibacillus farraposensis]|uniref:Cyclic lactone autoinducer peptide n=1 Tax=Paenibacillus farraposensis TaxID=2807095 RepID=A0ABW4D9K3_9BACL|nr:hypothetical protein [Paenibacillus farraposensis]
MKKTIARTLSKLLVSEAKGYAKGRKLIAGTVKTPQELLKSKER